jgi:hypothetical protein
MKHFFHVTMTALFVAACSAATEVEPPSVERGALKDEPAPAPLDRLGLFADTCEAGGGALSSKSDDGACCSLCDEKEGCSELCVDWKTLEELPPLTDEQLKTWQTLVDEATSGGDGSTTRQNDDPPPGTYGECKEFCRDVWHVCDWFPIPGKWCWHLGMGCVGRCVDVFFPL